MPRKAIAPAVPVANLKPDSPKVALILAAEIIFARDGIESASLREIAAQAGQRNHHAVQYHFGSRDSLVQAVFDYRMLQMEPARGARLAAAEMAGSLCDLRTIAEIIFLPQLELINAFGDNSYAAFLSAYLLRYQASQFGQFGEQMGPNLARVLGLLRQCLSGVEDTVAQRRLVTACFMFLNILVMHTRGSSDKAEPFAAAVEDTLNQIVAALAAPSITPATAGA